MKKRFCAILIMLALLVSTAFAAGNDVIFRGGSGDDGTDYSYASNFATDGEHVYYMLNGNTLCMYDIAAHTQETFNTADLTVVGSFPGLIPAQASDDDDDDDEDDEDAEASDSTYSYCEVNGLFCYDGGLYAIVSGNVSDTSTSKVYGGRIYRLTPENGSVTVSSSGLSRLDWSEMTVNYGTYTYSREAQGCATYQDKLYILTSDDDGNSCVACFDLQSGDFEKLPIQNVSGFSIADDGRLVCVCLSYEDMSKSGIYIYDPETGAATRQNNVAVTDYDDLPSAAVLTNGTIYYECRGEIMSIGENSASTPLSVNEAPADLYAGTTAALTKDGRMLFMTSDKIQIMSLDPAQRANIVLHVNSSTYLGTEDKASYNLSLRDGDISVVLTRDFDLSSLVSNMMNQSSSVDVYIMDTSSQAFSSLYNRGYMLDLSASAKLTAAAAQLYPAFSSFVTKDGKLMAMPLAAGGYCLGYSPDALTKLGLTEDQLPRTWDELFDFLGSTLPGLLSGRDDVCAFEQYYGISDIKQTLFVGLLESYEAEYPNGSYTDDVIVNLAKKLDSVDFAALGVQEAAYTVDEDGDISYEMNYDNMTDATPLLSTYCNLTMDYMSTSVKPLFISFSGTQGAAVTLYAAFVNPYSQNKDAAIAYIEELVDAMSTTTRYTLYSGAREPVRPANFEEYKQELLDGIANYTDMLARLDEDSDEYDSISVSLAYAKQAYANVDNDYWTISPADIAQYESYADRLVPAKYSYLAGLMSSSDSDEFYSQFSEYYMGRNDAVSILTFIENKLRMMRLEDN